MALCPVRPKATYYPPLCWGALLEVGIISKKPSKIYVWSYPEIILNIVFLSSFLPSYEVQVTYDTILVSGVQ